MLRNIKQRKEEEGFTIIEVLIVLAIAALIMVVVFLAVPNLERSQRNNARKSDANNLLENLSEYVGNADGQLPSTGCGSTTTADGCSWVSYKPGRVTGVQYINLNASGASLPSAPDADVAYLLAGAVCDGVNATTTGATSRDYVIWYGIEGSTSTVCTKGS